MRAILEHVICLEGEYKGADRDTQSRGRISDEEKEIQRQEPCDGRAKKLGGESHERGEPECQRQEPQPLKVIPLTVKEYTFEVLAIVEEDLGKVSIGNRGRGTRGFD
ncbi:hypothetical protein VTL71DRAFT_5625 [Oculimacula yallundae]|uniref:Uncharacterized protein n=1 Tax=Oculimacula yallundae TaxID=86028 RepID=A0ABR4C281_9HELO